MENEWTECCNEPVLYTYIDGVFEEWAFCKYCLKCYESYTADQPKEKNNE